MGVSYPTYATPRADLGEAVHQFIIQPNEFAAPRIAPLFPTRKKAATVSVITREAIAKAVETARASGGTYNRVNIAGEDLAYACEEHGLEGPLPDDQRKLYQDDFDAELEIVRATTRKVLLAQEIRLATLLWNATTWTGSALYTDVSSTAPFATAGSDVIGAIRAACEKVRIGSGVLANTVIMNRTNFNYCKSNTAIKAAVQYTDRTTDAILGSALADLFGVARVIVADAVYDSAKEGQDFTGAYVWSATYAMVAAIPAESETRNLMAPAVARTFLWTEDSPEDPVVEQYHEEQTRSEIYRVRHSVDEKVIDPYFAHLLKVA